MSAYEIFIFFIYHGFMRNGFSILVSFVSVLLILAVVIYILIYLLNIRGTIVFLIGLWLIISFSDMWTHRKNKKS